MEFGQLTEYNMRNIFTETYTKRGENYPQNFFFKKIKIEHISESIA